MQAVDVKFKNYKMCLNFLFRTNLTVMGHTIEHGSYKALLRFKNGHAFAQNQLFL
jgi:hypothetical protein